VGSCCLAALTLCAPASASASEGAPTPLEVRAVFLLHLARFVRWPDAMSADRRQAFVIGYAANDPIAIPIRQTIQGESIGDHPIELLELRRREDIERCNLVYLGDTLSGDAIRAIRRQREQPVLFVGNADGLLEAGGHVQFYQRGSQVRLRIDPENLRVAHLVPNSQLLRVATTR
jgi:hypothetical protein